MTDIVERLRNWGGRSYEDNHRDALVAADEIERLRKIEKTFVDALIEADAKGEKVTLELNKA